MNPHFTAILLSLAAAASWGAGDFNGGLASKRTSVYVVVSLSQLLGLLALTGMALLLGEALSAPRDLLLGGFAGLAGAAGLLGLYRGLADGKMGIVAPLTAVSAAGFPVILGSIRDGLPPPAQLLGIGIGLLAVWLISVDDTGKGLNLRGLVLPLAAGISFGLFFVLLDQLSSGAVLWPLVSARLLSAPLVGWIGWRRRPAQPAALPWLLILLAGLFDSAGNAFFTLAAGAGRLDLAAVIGSLYPAVTVLLAWIVLREPLTRRQWGGLLTALLAVALIAF